MKIFKKSLGRLAALLGASVLLSLPAAAQYESPVGTWDCVVSGRENGVAYLTFNGDYTFNGYEVLTPKKIGTTIEEPDRGDEDSGRTVETSVSGSEARTNFLGFALISGNWSWDITGKKILGFYTEGNGNSQSCITNQEVTQTTTTEIVDNGDGSYTTNLTTFYVTNEVRTCETVGVTNNLSFTAIVKPGTRLSLKAVSANGNKTLKGVPAMPIPDLTGNFYSEGKKSELKFIEFLYFSAAGDLANGFDVLGGGPGYELEGIALASRQKKMGLVYRGSRADDPLVSVFGSFNYSTFKGSLKGFDSDDAKITYKITPQFPLD